MGESVIRLSLGFHLLALLSPPAVFHGSQLTSRSLNLENMQMNSYYYTPGTAYLPQKAKEKRTLKIIKTKPIICFNK